MVGWALTAVGAGAAAPRPGFGAFYGGWLGLLGLLLMFPAVTTAAARVTGFRAPHTTPGPAAPHPAVVLLAWAVAVVVAALIASRWVPLRGLHMYSGDYFASFLLLAGLPLAVWSRDSSQRSSVHSLSGAFCGLLLGLVTISSFGAWLNWQLTGAWLGPARWARFPFLVLSLLPICYAEERTLGDPSPLGRIGRMKRLTLYFGLRSFIWLVLLAVWQTGTANALLPVVYVAFLGALSVGQRLGADALRRRTGSVPAAAIFNAILGAWFVAVVFPLA